MKISSYFSFWKLDYFSDMAFFKNIFDTRKILNDKHFRFSFLYPANRIEFFSVVLKSDLGCVLLNINPFPIGEIPTKVFPVWVFYVTESLCTKIVVARLESAGLRLKHGNIASIKTTHVTKILWIVLSWIYNMDVLWHHYGRHLCTQSWFIKVYVPFQWPESYCL